VWTAEPVSPRTSCVTKRRTVRSRHSAADHTVAHELAHDVSAVLLLHQPQSAFPAPMATSRLITCSSSSPKGINLAVICHWADAALLPSLQGSGVPNVTR
jgi:hypothetical protein